MSELATQDSRYRIRSWGPLHHRWWKTDVYKDSMVEETWHLGPFDLVRDYVHSAPKYGSWHLTFTLSLRRWRGPWLHVGVGSGAQDWDKDDEFWKERDDD